MCWRACPFLLKSKRMNEFTYNCTEKERWKRKMKKALVIILGLVIVGGSLLNYMGGVISTC